MDFRKFSGVRVNQNFRLVSNPVNVHSLSRYPFNGHAEVFGTIVPGNILIVVSAELCVLVAGWMLLLISQPHEIQIRFAAGSCNALIDGRKVRHDGFVFPAHVLWWIEFVLNLSRSHLLQFFESFVQFLIPGHDARNCAVSNLISATAILIRYAAQPHIYDAYDCGIVLHDN